MNAEIGQRVAASMSASRAEMTQRAIADAVGMAPDAFSRALRGQRGFSSIELARLADVLAADIHWLITGVPDPQRLTVAARHDFDFASGRRDVPGRTDDQQTLEDVALAYKQAYQGSPCAAPALPDTAEAVRKILGEDFVRLFADRLEQHLQIDVVRVAGLSTSYSFSLAGRRAIVVAATGNWFRENWSIAHELGHLVKGHHEDRQNRPDEHEAQANAFAAELLLPAAAMNSLNWNNLDEAELARRIWQTGVSTEALSRRLSALSITAHGIMQEWAEQPTQRLLRRHWISPEGESDPITRRMDEAAARRFPLDLQNRHVALIAEGSLGTGTLAWMLGIPAEDLEVDAPMPAPDIDIDGLANALGL